MRNKLRAQLYSILNGDERVVFSRVPPFSPLRLPADWSTSVNRQVQSEDNMSLF